METEIKKISEFIDKSVTPFHAVKNSLKEFKNAGFKILNPKEKWDLKRGEKYAINFDSAIIAFVTGEKNEFRIAASHTDSPSIVVKPNPIIREKNYIKLNSEIYGGSILNTWLDRPLSLAGKVVTDKGAGEVEETLVDFDRPIAVIPNLAIHQNREINKGLELNKQKDMLPVISLSDGKFQDLNMETILHNEFGFETENILSYELFFYPYQKCTVVGLNNEFISGSRFDNLAMLYACTMGMTCASHKAISVAVGFNNEEVGSMSYTGADSNVLLGVLKRIAHALEMDTEDFEVALNNSFMVSCDMAHAVHPNIPEKTDITNIPLLNKGLAIKINSLKKYTSDAYSVGVFTSICKNKNIPYQFFVNRSDLPGGSTIGPISASHISVPSIDIGTPMLAMHSSTELMGVKDTTYVKDAIKAFYEY